MNTITKIKEILVAIIVAGGAVSCMPKLALAKVKPDVPEQFQYTATADTASVADLEWRQITSGKISTISGHHFWRFGTNFEAFQK